MENHYDTVVVGTGIGGLTAAAVLAKAGQRVLAVERHDRVGGYAHSFRRGPYQFDAAVHLVGGCENGGLLDQLLTRLGVRDRCDFVPVNPCYHAEFPGFAISAPTGLDEFRAAYQEAFPESASGIAEFLDACVTIRSETQRSTASDTSIAPAQLSDYPALQRYRRATVDDLLDATIQDPRARAALTTLWPYVGLPPSKLSFLYWASMLLSYVDDGAYYCKGTFQHFANTLADVVRQNRGDIVLRTAVERIETDDSGTASGVLLDNGESITADRVLSNADLQQTVSELVGGDRYPARYRKSLARLSPSVSAVVAYIATDVPATDIAPAHETFTYSSWNHDEGYRGSETGEPSWYSITLPSVVDPELAPAGDTLLVYTTLVPYAATENWHEAKPRLRDNIVGQLERRVPGFAQRIKLIELGTPQTMIRYTRNAAGALYGWELSPGGVGPGRPGVRSPVPGLYQAGHWTQPGGGIYGVVTSGLLAARAMLGVASEDDLWRQLQ